ncbi:MAG: 2-dehydropantoate 2-reductase [Candidatus Eremiobacteraeota bacterium]|nr:2-dehydropantoate 2-reductase [Candidatus Eremiobacteraeota bacterium]
MLCNSKILVYGAGAIGGYLGGTLLAAGLDVTLLGRERVGEAFSAHGLTLTDYEGRSATLAGEKVPFITSSADYDGSPDVVLLTVKCTGLEEAARDLASLVGPQTVVACCQNGIGTKELVARYLPAQTIAAMVPFNVAWLEEARLHRGTEGKLLFQGNEAVKPLVEAWRLMGVPAGTRSDFTPISWGKLLLNLNNAINALAGVPLLEELHNRDYRRILSACMRELLAALKKADIKPAKLTKAPPFLVPWILLLPNWLFRVIAQQMLAIDPLARSSMWDDLQKRRPTEIEFLNQAVVELAFQQGLTAPVNERIVGLIREAESSGEGSPGMSSSDMVSRLL